MMRVTLSCSWLALVLLLTIAPHKTLAQDFNDDTVQQLFNLGPDPAKSHGYAYIQNKKRSEFLLNYFPQPEGTEDFSEFPLYLPGIAEGPSVFFFQFDKRDEGEWSLMAIQIAKVADFQKLSERLKLVKQKTTLKGFVAYKGERFEGFALSVLKQGDYVIISSNPALTEDYQAGNAAIAWQTQISQTVDKPSLHDWVMYMNIQNTRAAILDSIKGPPPHPQMHISRLEMVYRQGTLKAATNFADSANAVAITLDFNNTSEEFEMNTLVQLKPNGPYSKLIKQPIKATVDDLLDERPLLIGSVSYQGTPLQTIWSDYMGLLDKNITELLEMDAEHMREEDRKQTKEFISMTQSTMKLMSTLEQSAQGLQLAYYPARNMSIRNYGAVQLSMKTDNVDATYKAMSGFLQSYGDMFNLMERAGMPNPPKLSVEKNHTSFNGVNMDRYYLQLPQAQNLLAGGMNTVYLMSGNNSVSLLSGGALQHTVKATQALTQKSKIGERENVKRLIGEAEDNTVAMFMVDAQMIVDIAGTLMVGTDPAGAERMKALVNLKPVYMWASQDQEKLTMRMVTSKSTLDAISTLLD